MSTVVRDNCPYGCGEFEFDPTDIHLQTYAPAGRDFYEWVCPECENWIVKPAPEIVVIALRSGRVPETRIFLPAEAADPQRRRADLITRDEELDFMLALDVLATVPVDLVND